jgi:hypothetical protein
MKKFLTVFLLLLSIISGSFQVGASSGSSILLPAVTVSVSGEKWGYINETGSFVIQPVYAYASDFNDKGIAVVADGNYSYEYCNVYFINKSGEKVSGPFYSYVPNYVNGIAIINAKDDSSILVDESGKVILRSKYSILDYSNDLLIFYDSAKKLSGLMDISGKIVVPAKYSNIQSLGDGNYRVETTPDKYAILDKTGKLQSHSYDYLYISDGLGKFEDKKSNLSGYKKADGTIAIKPQFRQAGDFIDGYAVVGINGGKYFLNYGLIDKNGSYVIKPEYSGIKYLGQGMFSVSQDSGADSSGTDYYSFKALFNSKGEKLTDYKYYRINNFNGDYASASDNTATFFIDKKGNIAETLPKLQGIGDMTITGDIIKAALDGSLAYLKPDGNIIWKKDDIVNLNNSINVKKVKYRRDYITYVEYPEISGLQNQTIQQSINKKLKDMFLDNFENHSKDKPEDGYPEDVNIGFTANISKNLIIINKSGYIFPIGAAHGMPSQDYIYIDSKTGAFYTLKDLFKAGSKYTEKLTSIVNTQLSLNARIGKISGGFGYFENSIKVSGDQGFIIGKDSIKVYYVPYAIAAYVAGFPEFEIPYGQLTGIIDTKGAFWNSFDKTIVSRKIHNTSDIGSDKLKSIETLLGAYEKNIVEAVNSNNFSKVEATLQKGSSLYNSQKKLVQELYKKGTKEKLTDYEIYAVDFDFDKDEYRVYVIENVAVKYKGKNFTNQKYQWCYSVKPDSSGNFKLSGIQKW